MLCRQPYCAAFLTGAYPDRACPADECEWIIADQFRRSCQRECDRIVCVRSDRTKLISHPYDNACRVCSVGHQLKIIRDQNKLAVDTSARESLCYRQLPVDVPLCTQIAPSYAEFPQIELGQVQNEWRIFQMFKLCPVRIDLCYQDPRIAFQALSARQYLEVIAV